VFSTFSNIDTNQNILFKFIIKCCGSLYVCLFAFLLGSISSTFYAQFFCRYPFTKKLRSQNVTEKSFKKHFCTKNVRVKCWWNWRLVSISSTFYTQIFCTKVCSKPNSKQRKDAQKTFIWKNWPLVFCFFSSPAIINYLPTNRSILR